MSSNDTKPNGKMHQVVLRDLESMLRKSINDQVIVVNFTTSQLLPKGENYGSTMLKVNAVIKRDAKSPEEDLPLVAKMIPASEFQMTYFNCTNSFRKEIYVFEKLIPAFIELEKEAGVKNEELFNILPKYYGGRLSRNENTDTADEDVVLLMENLKARQYIIMDKSQGLDLEHAKVAITTLARFHALGTGLHLKKPDLFEEAGNIMNFMPFDCVDFVQDVSQYHLDTLCTDPRIAKYRDRMDVVKDSGWDYMKNENLDGPWISIIHGDFWVNNMMFQKENGQIKDIKLVDFQFSKTSNPLRDIPYFLCGSVNSEILETHIDELLDIYFNRYIEELKRIGIDTTPYTKESFEENLKKAAHPELFHCLLAIKFFTAQVSEDTDLNEIKQTIMMGELNKSFIERSWSAISVFVKKNWI